jgi:uncharacterized protein involved in exopolysaccharide biosynthesis
MSASNMNEYNAPDLPEDDGIKLLDFLQTLAENARLLIYGPLIVGLVALGVTFLLNPIYIATTSIMTPQQQQGGAAAVMAQLGALAGLVGAAGPKSPAELYVGLLKSRTVADRLIDRFGLMTLPEVETREDARELLARLTGMSAGRDGLITIKVVSSIPRKSAAMANAYVEELSILTGRLAVTEAQKRRRFLEKEVAKAKKNLAKAEIALGGVGVSENTLKFNPATMGQGIATLKAQTMAKELQLTSMRGYLTENSPSFRLAQQELAALREQLGRYENTQPTGKNAEYINRYRDFKYYEVLFEQVSKQYELAKVDELSDGAVIQIVDVAVPPERNERMAKPLVALLAALAAGFLLLPFVLIRHALKKAFQDPEAASKMDTVRAGFGRVLKPWRRHANSGRHSVN